MERIRRSKLSLKRLRLSLKRLRLSQAADGEHRADLPARPCARVCAQACARAENVQQRESERRSREIAISWTRSRKGARASAHARASVCSCGATAHTNACARAGATKKPHSVHASARIGRCCSASPAAEPHRPFESAAPFSINWFGRHESLGKPENISPSFPGYAKSFKRLARLPAFRPTSSQSPCASTDGGGRA